MEAIVFAGHSAVTVIAPPLVGPKPKCDKTVYAQRYKIERTFAWLGNFRRILIRWEKRFEAFKGFVTFACMYMTIRKVPT